MRQQEQYKQIDKITEPDVETKVTTDSQSDRKADVFYAALLRVCEKNTFTLMDSCKNYKIHIHQSNKAQTTPKHTSIIQYIQSQMTLELYEILQISHQKP